MQDVLAGRLFRTRSGALVIGVVAALLAAILLVVYLRQYRSSVDSGARPMTVLVAKSLIPKGTSGSIIGEQELFQVASVPRSQLKNLAISDPAAIAGRVAVADIYPGQQLTASDFTVSTTNAIPTRITGAERAIALPVDSSHGLIGQVSGGDHVDVYVGVNTPAGPVLKLLASDIEVLQAPGGGGNGVVGGGGGSNAVLQVTAKQAALFAFSSDNGRIWLVLRPQSGARATPPETVDVTTLLAGAKPLGKAR